MRKQPYSVILGQVTVDSTHSGVGFRIKVLYKTCPIRIATVRSIWVGDERWRPSSYHAAHCRLANTTISDNNIIAWHVSRFFCVLFFLRNIPPPSICYRRPQDENAHPFYYVRPCLVDTLSLVLDNHAFLHIANHRCLYGHGCQNWMPKGATHFMPRTRSTHSQVDIDKQNYGTTSLSTRRRRHHLCF